MSNIRNEIIIVLKYLFILCIPRCILFGITLAIIRNFLIYLCDDVKILDAKVGYFIFLFLLLYGIFSIAKHTNLYSDVNEPFIYAANGKLFYGGYMIENIKNIEVVESSFMKITHIGKLKVTTSTGIIVIKYVNEPNDLVKKLNNQITQNY